MLARVWMVVPLNTTDRLYKQCRVRRSGRVFPLLSTVPFVVPDVQFLAVHEMVVKLPEGLDVERGRI